MTYNLSPKSMKKTVRWTLYWAVDRAVVGAVDNAVNGAVHRAVVGAVYWAVDGAVYGAVYGAVDWAVRVGPLHPNLRLFMSDIQQTH